MPCSALGGCIVRGVLETRDSDEVLVHLASGGYNVPLDTNPFNGWAKVLDCGDIPVTS